MNREQLKARYPHASESFIRLNSETHGNVAGLGGSEPKQNRRRESEDRSVEAGTECAGRSMVAIVVAITSFRRRPLDTHDNLRAAHKALVDRITDHLGAPSDADPRITWEYHQVITKGKTGTQVLITVK